MSTQTAAQTQIAAKPAITPVVAGLLQRQCACGNHTAAGGECEACRKKHEGTLQRAAVNSSPVNKVPLIVHEVLRSPGQPLDAATRAFMEPRFGHDFSSVPTRAHGSVPTPARLTIGAPHDEFEQEAEMMAQQVTSQSATSTGTGYDLSSVRIHTDDKAAESARAVNALAYAFGHDIVFGAGQFAPGTNEGRRLIAHELTHVVQQSGSDSSGVDSSYDPALQRRATAYRGLQRSPNDPVVGVESPLMRPDDIVVRGITYHPVWDKTNQVWDMVDASGHSLYSTVIVGGKGADPLAVPKAEQYKGSGTVKVAPPPSSTTQYFEFQIGPPDPAHPQQIQLTSTPVTERDDYIDNRMMYLVYGLYLGGFNIYIQGLDTPIFVSNKYVKDRTVSARVGDRIFNSIDEANASVAAYTRPGDKTPHHAYYWGAGGAVIAPTVFSVATTPRIMATLFKAREELVNQVQRELGLVAEYMVIGKVLDELYRGSYKVFTGDVPPKPAKLPAGRSEQVTKGAGAGPDELRPGTGATSVAAQEPKAILPDGTAISPDSYSGGYYGTADLSPDVVTKSGFPARGDNWNLQNHTEELWRYNPKQVNDSAFRGTTSVPSDPANQGGAAYVAGEGGYVYEVRGVPTWDVNKALQGRVGAPGSFRGNLMHGENEYVIPAKVPPENIVRWGEVKADRTGRLYVKWHENK
jgi:hypothetical protein